MKKIILFLITLCFSISAYAQLSDAYSTIETKVTKLIKTEDVEENCPVYSDTPMSSIKRPNFEIDFRLGVLDSPSGGSFAFRTDNYDLILRHNLSSTLWAYASYGIRNFEKPEYDWSLYNAKWESRMLFGGIGIYVTPTISFHAGGGRIWLTNENGEEPELGFAIERGISIDNAFGNNKVILSYRIVDATLSTEDDIKAEEVQGDGSFSVLSVSFSVPLNWD